MLFLLIDDRARFQSVQAILFGPYLLAGMTNGDWDLNIGNATSFSDCIASVPAGYASQLFTFSQEWKISGSSESNNNILVLAYNNSSESVIMNSFPDEGTDKEAHATFRVIDSNSENPLNNTKHSYSAIDLMGKNVSLELFDRPGMFIAHQGIDNNLNASQKGESTIFNVLPGLDGNNNSLSFESANLPGCFIYGGTNYQVGQTVQLQCKPTESDLEFDRAVSYIANVGIKTYHPIGLIARGSKRSYLLSPLLAFRDETYTVYFRITP